MSNHTPGPWYAEKQSTHAGEIATCHWNEEDWWEVWSPNWSDCGSAEGNARLIAAAPLLLKEIEYALVVASAFDESLPLGEQWKKRVRNLIAEVRGEV